MGVIVTEQDENLMQPIEEVVPPKPAYQPPQSYQSSSSDWAILDMVGEGLEAVVDIFNIFD
jgi:hypothetical protein